ncbi:unnamed protein product [Peronospora belbahrii]|nr:unnamed protein product [Peronospora belbahrii]
MAALAVTTVEFDATGCIALSCSQPDNTTYNANEFCTGTKMLTAAKCLMDNFSSDTSSYTAMWSDGGYLEMIPEIRAVMHGWLDPSTNKSYLLSAVHTMSIDSEPAYGTCNEGGYGSLVLPCHPMSGASSDVVKMMSLPIATPWMTTWIKQYQPSTDTAVNGQSDNDGSGVSLWLLIPLIIAAVVVTIFIFFIVFRKRRRLQSAYWQRSTPAGTDSFEPREKSTLSVPVAKSCQKDNTTSLRRTKQETLGEFSQTLRLPGEEDSSVEEPSPMIEEVLPRPRRNTAPVSMSSLAARGSYPVGQTNSQVYRSGTVPAAQSIASGAQTEASACIAPTAQSRSFGASTRALRHSTAQTSTFGVRHPSAHALSNAMSQAAPRSFVSGQRSKSEVHGTRSLTYSHAPTDRELLPTLRESVLMPKIRGVMPSICDSIQADRELIPAMRETFCRYSAADSVHYTLTTDPNLVGKRIAWERIELGSLLSRGAYGEVWACRYAGQKVAIKRLLQSKEPTFHATENFKNEIQLTASLNHPNIVRFIGVTWSSLVNLAMVIEYLPRGDMQNYLQRNGDLITWARDKIDMAIGVVKAIAYLHSREVIHRDIKARNVLLTKRLQPKLIDFGASRLSAPSEMSAGIGTPYWTAPEVLESTEYTEKADIYSFGVLLSELDTCKAPYHNRVGTNGEKMKPFHILTEVVDGSLRPSLSTGCPERIRKAADACFQHDPNMRPSALELIKLLDG